MDVILLQDVKGLGKKGETKSCSDGYAINFLIPRKLAVRKTEGSVRVLEKQNADEAKRQEELRKAALENKNKIESVTLEFKAKAQADLNMAGTISTKEITNKIKEELNITVDKRKFIDKYPVNAFGVTNLRLELYKDVVATVKIHVSEEK